MLNSDQDKLQLARARFLDQITAKETEIRTLRTKLSLIDEMEAMFKESGKDLPSAQKYAGTKLTKAALDAVQTLGTNGGVSASGIRNYIAANGYKHPNPANFAVATVIALTRLAEQGKINSDKIGGKRLFKVKI